MTKDKCHTQKQNTLSTSGTLSRRDLLGAVGRTALLLPLASGGLGVLLSSCSSTPAVHSTKTSNNHITFTTGAGLINSFLEQYVAADLGFWSKRGLDVKIVSGIDTSDDVQEVVSGTSDFTTGGFPTIPEIVDHDLQLVNVVGDFQRVFFVIASYTPRAITSMEQLRGKTVGIISVGGAEVVELDVALHLAGIPSSDIKTVVVGLGPDVYQLAVEGKIDAWMAVDSINASLIAAGDKITNYRPSSIAASLGRTAQAYMTRRDLIEQQPSVVQAYVDGTIEAMEYCLKESHWQTAASAWRKYDSTATYAALKPAMPTLIADWTNSGTAKVGSIDMAAYQRSIDLLHEVGLMKKRVAADTVATTEFVTQAYANLKI